MSLSGIDLADAVLSGQKWAAAKLITLIEQGEPEAQAGLSVLRKHAGRAEIVGLAGPPGSGKSTLAACLVQVWREKQRTVGVIAVDPSSPRSGGALLGDRARMTAVGPDPGVFVRSMASRGSLGGLAEATFDAVDVLDAMGCDVVLVEAVGGGQCETAIADLAHVSVVLQVPGMGDDLQALKAGILEVADILVVNKADLPGAEEVARRLEWLVAGNARGSVAVLRTVATRGEGVAALAEEIARQIRSPLSEGRCDRRLATARRRVLAETWRLLQADLLAALGEEYLQTLIEGVCQRRLGFGQAAESLIRKWEAVRGFRSGNDDGN